MRSRRSAHFRPADSFSAVNRKTEQESKVSKLGYVSGLAGEVRAEAEVGPSELGWPAHGRYMIGLSSWTLEVC